MNRWHFTGFGFKPATANMKMKDVEMIAQTTYPGI